MLGLLRSLPSFRPGIAYVIDKTLYLAPTARSPAANTMRSCRGPGFANRVSGLAPLPASRASLETVADSGFVPLPAGALEPSAEELATLVNELYAALSSGATGGMGESDGGIVFQGEGDPLEAAAVVLETVGLVAQHRNGLAFRLNTLGLCDAATVDLLLSSDVLVRGDDDRRRETRLASISVFLPAAEPTQYAELLQPRTGLGFSDVCAFVVRAAEAGVDVECTTVARPDVDVAAVERLAMGLGARSFRTRSWLG